MPLLFLATLLYAAVAQATPAPVATLDAAVARLVTGGAAVVVANARNGAELFSGGFADQALPPGSIFKLVTALAAAREMPGALLHPRFCPPPATPEGPDGHGQGHGWIGLEDALAHSCNRYFASLGRELGTGRLLRTLSGLGLELPEPPPEPADELAVGTGVRLTAHQQVALLRIVATGWMPPGKTPPERTVLARLQEGMCKAVAEGTARAVRGRAHVAICGKTGTAFLNDSPLGWFGGYAPMTDPEVVVIVGLRGRVGRDAARAARALFDAYFLPH